MVAQKSIIKFLILVFSIVLIQACKSAKDINPAFEKYIVWDEGENNVDGYRIPGIVVSSKGTLLAFTEERPDYSDEAPKFLVLKRSTSNGESWSENIYIEISDGKFWELNREGLPASEKDKKEVWTNVAPIVDQKTGAIHFFYALSEGEIDGENLQRYTRVFFKTSMDDGLTWSERKEVTDILKINKDGKPNKDENGEWLKDENGFPCDYLGRAFHMPGPGHGIQLSDGRLLLQLWNRKALGIPGKGQIPSHERMYGVSTIYSDDHGKTWHYGSAFGHELYINESRMAQLENGDVIINSRYRSPNDIGANNHRVTAISRDRGVTWDNIKVDSSFTLSNNCDAGLLAFQDDQNRNVLLYSKNESIEGRKNLIVKYSFDNGATWSEPKVIDKGNAMYSDLAVSLDKKDIYLLYETAKGEPVYCVKFNLAWLESK